MLPRTASNVQRLIDEYVGALGSAAIVSRDGHVLFQSAHDDSAVALTPMLRHVAGVRADALEPRLVPLCVDQTSSGYVVALSEDHVLLVVTDCGVTAGAATVRVKNAARLLRRVLAVHGAASPAGGASGAPAELHPAQNGLRNRKAPSRV